jgi:hypothetical protein
MASSVGWGTRCPADRDHVPPVQQVADEVDPARRAPDGDHRISRSTDEVKAARSR